MYSLLPPSQTLSPTFQYFEIWEVGGDEAVYVCMCVCVCKNNNYYSTSIPYQCCYQSLTEIPYQAFTVISLSLHLQDLSKAQEWEGVHHFKSGQPAPCTAVGVCRGGGGAVSLVTGGEDGRITVIRLDSQKPLRVIGTCMLCVTISYYV